MKVFPSLQADHPVTKDGTTCPLCTTTFREGDITTIVPVSPASEEDAEKMRAGRPYTAEGKLVHVQCLREFTAAAREVGF